MAGISVAFVAYIKWPMDDTLRPVHGVHDDIVTTDEIWKGKF